MNRLYLFLVLCFIHVAGLSQSCLPEGITFTKQSQIDSFQINYLNCTEIEGYIKIRGNDVYNVNGLNILTYIGGDLNIVGCSRMKNLTGLDNLVSIGGSFYMCRSNRFQNLKGLNNLTSIGGALTIYLNDNLSDFIGLDNLKTIGDSLYMWGRGIRSLEGLNNLTSIGGALKIEFSYAIKNLSALDNLSFVGGNLWIEDNALMTNLTGLNNLTSIGGDLWIEDLDRIVNLSGLNNLTSIGGSIYIHSNNLLTSLSGLDNINAGSINKLNIFDNTILSKCEIKSICDYLLSPNGEMIICNNAPGCNSQEEIKEACESSCLPEGITFFTQSQINNFQSKYPDCTEIEGDVEIVSLDGISITDISGLNNITSIRGNLIIEGNKLLNSLRGLESLAFIGGCLSIVNNFSLDNLSGFNNLTSIGSDFLISQNTNLIGFSGLNNLTYIGANLLIKENTRLTDLTDLSYLSLIGGDLIIENNPNLKSLMGIENVDASYTNNIFIHDNSSLSYCEVQSMCSFLSFSKGTVEIYNNAAGCNNPEEIANACGFSVSDNIGILRKESEIKNLRIRQSRIFLVGMGAFVLIIILGAIVFIRQRKIRAQYALELERVKSEKLKELDHLKSQFFANISHEFRTPLTLIMGPLDRVLTRSEDKNDKKELGIAKKYARNLQNLINNLLSISKLESGKMLLQASEIDIVKFVSIYIQSFESLAKQKNIALKFSSESKEIRAFIDREKFEQILNNLLSNAFKFTGSGGRIEVIVGSRQYAVGEIPENRNNTAYRLPPTVNLPEKCTVISISDTGSGIEADQLPHIFDRFYQVEQEGNSYYEGTGIGLALTKELVDLHHGDISVESKPETGTTFTVALPLGNEHLSSEEIETSRQLTVDSRQSTIDSWQSIPEPETRNPEPETDIDKPLLLVVEDNDDLRSYILSYLTPDYRITQAVDGEMGLDKAIEQIPDLVISDVMMPKMDGYQLCQKLKTDERTSHIPIIILTARASMESRIEGLETGADDFITKPFEPPELLTRIKNLIMQRRLLHERFMKNVQKIGIDQLVKFDTPDLTSMDQSFLQKVTEYVIQNISNFEFNVEMLGDKMALSRRQLQRKLIGITGHSPNMFIRSVRLNRAAELLRNKAGNVTEIAYDVGFNNLSWFAKSFKEQFGVLPSEYPLEKSK